MPLSVIGFPGWREETSRPFDFPGRGLQFPKAILWRKSHAGRVKSQAGDAGGNRDPRGRVTCNTWQTCCAATPAAYGIWNLPSCSQSLIQWVLVEFPLCAVSCAVSWAQMVPMKCVQQMGKGQRGAGVRGQPAAGGAPNSQPEMIPEEAMLSLRLER